MSKIDKYSEYTYLFCLVCESNGLYNLTENRLLDWFSRLRLRITERLDSFMVMYYGIIGLFMFLYERHKIEHYSQNM